MEPQRNSLPTAIRISAPTFRAPAGILRIARSQLPWEKAAMSRLHFRGWISLAVLALGLNAGAADPLPAGAVARFGSPRLQDFTIDRSAAFSPDGKLIATSGSYSSICVWDV